MVALSPDERVAPLGGLVDAVTAQFPELEFLAPAGVLRVPVDSPPLTRLRIELPKQFLHLQSIGLVTATNLAGPWTDQGLVVAGNNAIDPAPLVDGGNQWLTWGNWQTGIDLLQLYPA